ncbi:DNA-directed RNA polymerase I RPA12 [Babesia ovis]|uniref:DNA-directed RNA polymerase I RPA12 n=1 Tax=Babesia ovis TaxID=5869 RepID=A0A9W5TAU4_BABOV|nr:DNA-directed RNA polymerase I RPA12 [Babesia ovis]
MDPTELDILLEAAEHGENIQIAAHDTTFNKSIANLNVKEAIDMAKYLYAESGLDAGGRQLINKFKYQIHPSAFHSKAVDSLERKDHVSYDYLVALGCPRCDASVDFKSPNSFFDRSAGNTIRRELKCNDCGATIAPIFTSNCTDVLVDSCRRSATFGRGSEGEKAYIYGFRQGCEFDRSAKKWWIDSLQQDGHDTDDAGALFMAKNANKSSREVVKQLCDKCGCEEAYYSTFQARSADEGMTVMYECKQCKNRTVVNT